MGRSIKLGPLKNVLGIAGGRAGNQLAQWRKTVLPEVNALDAELRKLDEREMRKRSLSLRYRVKSGERLGALVPEAFALVRESARRTLGMRHFDVQILGGVALFHGAIAEMETGEGKTLTATLPLYLHAMEGKGAHLATVNDYLAKRDAEWMMPIYQTLGLSVGVIQQDDSSDQRREAYACDITYGTSKEFGFDFLRDRLLLRRMGFRQEDFLGSMSSHRFESAGGAQPVQRGSHFVLVDEADSILIDEARTPLIIGTIEADSQERVAASFNWAASASQHFVEEEHYTVDEDKNKKVELNAAGRQLVRAISKPESLDSVGLVDLYEYVERAIKVNRDFHVDEQYIVRDDEIVIVDEFTGRLAEGRKWRDGIHQALEAKEGLEVSMPGGHAARVTVQDLFLRYTHLAGMTGTARTSARELYKIYKTRVISVPTNRPVQRKFLPARVFRNDHDKFQAVVQEVSEVNAAGRPVLIGTRSIEKSQQLSDMLNAAGLEHEVLNANEVEREAEIVQLAGQTSRITVATNMAGRGTDIKLGEGVADLGGLHVICTEFHDAARVDRQLAGRCGRQGDPGSVRQYLSLEDDIIRAGYGPDAAERIAKMGGDGNLDKHTGLLRRAQRKVERDHFRARMVLLHHEKERKKIQREMGQDPYLDSPE